MPKEVNPIEFIEETDFSSIFKIDSDEFFHKFNLEVDKSIPSLTAFCDKFDELDDTMRSYLTECMQNEVSASFDGYEEYVKEATIANKGLTLSAKLSKVALEALATVGNMFITWAFTKAIEFAIKKLDEWIVTAEEAREKLSDIKTELKSIDQQLKDNEELIKELEKIKTPSITDKEDLDRLKAENEELAVRKCYLEMQKEDDEKVVSDIAKRNYKLKYNPISRNDIDSRLTALKTPKSSNGVAGSYLTGDTSTTSATYGAGRQTSIEYNELADLIAKYELYSEKKKEAIQNDNGKSLENYNQKLNEVETKLIDCRTELQGFADEIGLTGDSEDLENVKNDLTLIDKTLFSAGERLVDYVNNTLDETDSEKLTALA